MIVAPIHDFVAKTRSRRIKIAVVGDILCDEYHYGSVSRVSPEFPALVLKSKSQWPVLRPGGAANVCEQLKHWNVDTYLVGFIEPFRQLLPDDMNDDYCAPLLKGTVPRKVRFYDMAQNPLPLRWDIEQPNYGEPDIAALRDRLFGRFRQMLEEVEPDVVVFSNYNKGVFDAALATDMVSQCQERKIPTIVDPKCEPISSWQNCTIFKPNQREANEMTGLLVEKEHPQRADWKRQLAELRTTVNCDSVIITQAGSGLIGLDKKGEFSYRHKSSPKRDVASVVGAGDCFAGILALATGHGFPAREAAALAFEAGAEYVRAQMNHPITPYELFRRLDKDAAKLVTAEEFTKIRGTLYGDGVAEIVLANGCYDILHAGHLHTLRFAKKQGHVLVVGLNSDESVRRLKGERRPIQTQSTRASILAALDCVDFVIIFDEETPEELIKKVKPTILVKGSDYAGKDIVGSNVAKVVLAETIPDTSTTRIIERIKK